MTTYAIKFEIDSTEFITGQISSDSEMIQKREKLKGVADEDSVEVLKYAI